MKKLISCLLICFFYSISPAQEWHWEYGKFFNRIPEREAWSQPLHIDFEQHIYTATLFDSVLLFNDTAFYLPPPVWSYQNMAISKVDPNGDLIKSLNLHSFPGFTIQEPMVATDSELNIYISVTFRNAIIINNTTISAEFAPESQSPRLLIAKFDPEFNLIWHGLIESPFQEMNNGLLVSPNDEIFLAVYHSTGYSIQSYQVSFLGQDTSQVFNRQVTSLLKLDTEGQLMWRKEIQHSYDYTRINQGKQRLFYGQNEKISLLYFIRHDLIIDNDTLLFPELTIKPYYGNVFLDFDLDGNLIDANLLSHGLWNKDIVFDPEGGYYFFGMASDTILFKHDTIVIPEGESHSIIGRIDHECRLKWFHLLQSDYGIEGMGFKNYKLIFTIAAKSNIHIIDTTIAWPGSSTNTIIVELDSLGQLTNLAHTRSKSYLRAWPVIDNCGNVVLVGFHKRFSIFDEDTLFTSHLSYSESLIARLNRVELPQIDLDPDTIACETYTLFAPVGYSYYRWNGIETNLPYHEVTESGTFELMVSGDEGCWLYASAIVDIYPGFNFSLGPDTTITTSDTLVLSIADEYDHYHWFDGSEDSELLLIGNDFGEGILDVWVEVSRGPCVVRDTLLLTIQIGSSLADNPAAVFRVKPNPFSQLLTIDQLQDIERIEILAMTGQKLFALEDPYIGNSSLLLNLSHFPAGIYLLNVFSGGNYYKLKIVKSM